MTCTRPILRYHGGKWLIAPKILGWMPPHRIYVEPFGGAASVLIQKPRAYAEIYNDLDGEIVNLFKVVRDQGAELIRRLELTPFSRRDFLDSYKPVADPVEQARRTITRSFMGFGSAAASGSKTGFRAHSHRSGTTPAKDWRNLPDCLWGLIERLRGVIIEDKDAIVVMTAHDGPDTVHYVDPPYVHSTRKLGNPYCKKQYRHEMTDEQHRNLAAFLRTVQGGVLLSGYACPLYEELYSGWERVSFKALADGARERTEVLWMRNVRTDLFSR